MSRMTADERTPDGRRMVKRFPLEVEVVDGHDKPRTEADYHRQGMRLPDELQPGDIIDIPEGQYEVAHVAGKMPGLKTWMLGDSIRHITFRRTHAGRVRGGIVRLDSEWVQVEFFAQDQRDG